MIKIGYKASAEQFGPMELLHFICLAEELGCDSAWISDHFQPWRHNGGHAPNSIAWLGAAGARTSRITLGTSVLTPCFRYHPSIVAQAFATLGAMFEGRIVLGVGTGESLNEVPASGMTWPEQSERTARLREAVELIERLWKEPRLTFEGRYYRTENATIYDRPDTQIPIFIAGAGPFMAKLAGKTADGFICTSGKPTALYEERLLPNLNLGLAERQRSAPFERMIEIKLSYDEDPGRALNNTRFWGALALSPAEKVDVEDPIDMERLADALPIERAASRWIVSSDPDAVIEAIRAYVAMGFNHLVFHSPAADQERFLKLLARDIIPRLKLVSSLDNPKGALAGGTVFRSLSGADGHQGTSAAKPQKSDRSDDATSQDVTTSDAPLF
ncbi:glucose-6-phosphate dehydrogenase (coenzyme-F420) [Sphingobium aquiterrae]|uniref:glucose-6-phosphate dehydrogenase (coenzyme-F420) n=1 Tax=Sphingobium aquiterrae TaxID=2038656 RepID=UPI00301AE37C